MISPGGLIATLFSQTGAAVAQGADAYFSSVSVLINAETSLVGQSGNSTFLDSSVNNLVVTFVGVIPAQGAFSPFSDGGSVYFNGSSEYLTIPADPVFTLGTGSFTVEAWVNLTNVAVNSYIASMNYEGSGGTGQWALYMTGAGATKQLWFNSSTGNNMATTTFNLQANTWVHVAYSRSGTSGRFFVNGTQLGTTLTDSKNYPTASGTFYVGRMATAANYFPGYISNLRVVKGTAVYTANFTPSTTPLTAISGTSVLLLGTNSAIVDATRKHNIAALGVDTTTLAAKYGSRSIRFDGATSATSRLQLTNASPLAFGSGDFTIEAWVYQLQRNTYNFIYNRASGGTNATTDIEFWTNASGNVVFAWYTGSTGVVLTTTGTVPLNTWTHIAVVRQSGLTKVYFNGVADAQTSTNAGANNALTVGGWVGNQMPAPTRSFPGYIDEFRITKGVARYTANFTAPTAAFPTN